MNAKYPKVIAIAFLTLWIAILYAGADHPPPVGFLWLVPLVAVCAFLVYRRVPIYAAWSQSHRSGRIRRVLLEGLVAGVVVGLIGFLIPGSGDPTISARQTADMAIWLAVLGVLGVVNALLLYAISSILPRDRR